MSEKHEIQKNNKQVGKMEERTKEINIETQNKMITQKN